MRKIFWGVFSFVVMLLMACQEKDTHSNKDLTIEAFSAMKTPSFAINSQIIRKHLSNIQRTDTGRMTVDREIRSYYRHEQPFLWINRHGVDAQADSLVGWLEKVGETDINPAIYRVERIKKDLAKLRSLSLTDEEDINKVMARLEFNLTRAYLRYACCQHFGYVNPNYTLNHCAVKDSDSTHVTYYHVFDVEMSHPSAAYYQKAYDIVNHDSVGQFLNDIQPSGKMYRQLVDYLRTKNPQGEQRQKVLCCIERCRWQTTDSPEKHDKYVVVNIPAYLLYAYGEDSVLTMRVGCGKLDTRTPLIHSNIKRMDLNPKWFVPKSIAKGIVGRIGYLKKNNMYIHDKKEGKLPPEQASYSRIMEGKQFIVQEGGPGNSLGRIIFRFDNNHSVYLHYTNTPWVFQKSVRAVSHGCVRVEKPFDLAVFLLKKKDSDLIEKIRYSMEADLNPNDNESDEKVVIDRDMLVNSVTVEPEIPVFISYFTCYPSSDGELRYYKDVYGYDEAIWKELKYYLL
jgi:murein L,D-transpeptidase YcbB/YkuD